MKMGTREFRERFSEIAEGAEPVQVTKNGRIIGQFTPFRAKPAEEVDWDEWMAEIERRQEGWKSTTPDWRERLAAIGLDQNGELIEA